MLYVPKIDDYSKVLTDEEVKDFVAINFSEYFKSIKEEQNIRKVAKQLYIFLTTPDEVKKMCNEILLIIVYIVTMLSENLNIFDPELQLINTKPIIKNK